MHREIVVAILVVGMGCVGGFNGGSALSFTAEPVRIADPAIQDSPFTVTAERPIQFNQSVSVGGEQRTVNLRVGMVQAKQTGNVPVPAHLIVLSVPAVELLGQTVSVADKFDPLSFINEQGSVSGHVAQERKVDDRHAQILGAERTVSVYRGSKSGAETEASILIYKSTFKHNDDTIVIVGFVPIGMDDTTASLLHLLSNIEHA